MDQAPILEKRQHGEGYGAVQVDLYSRKPDAASDAVFPPLCYASAALKSYRMFEKPLADGKIASGTRSTVALPTHLAPMIDRKCVVSGQSVSVRVGIGGRRSVITKKRQSWYIADGTI